MPSTNAELVDKTLGRATTLERLTAGEKREVLRLLDQLERDLVRDLETATLTRYRKARLEALLAQTRLTINTAYREIRNGQQAAMTDLVDLESQWQTRTLNTAINVPLTSVQWTEAQMQGIARNTVIDGAKSASWWASQAGDLRQRFSTTVKQGLLRGSTTDEIVRSVRGTKANNYTDGVMNLSRRQATTLVRTSVSAVAQETRLQTFKDNAQVLKGIQWLSTLDARTTWQWCIPRSQKLYTLDLQPIGHTLPWHHGPGKIHWQCRSQSVPVTKSWAELAGVPLKQADDKTLDQLFQENLRKRGWSEERIAAARRNQQASMDGQVPAARTYQEFLRGKSYEFQVEVLGRTRADLFRKGVIADVSQLVSQSGNPITVAQLKARYAIPEAA